MSHEQYSTPVADLLRIDVEYPLVPTRAAPGVGDTLSGLSHDDIFGEKPIANRQMADCCLSGLWLRFDFLDQSHEISQGIHTPTGSYWHAIMHRREPDWSNAKYWFRKAGPHAIIDDLLAAARELAAESSIADVQSLVDAASWDPCAFVDLCQEAHAAGGELDVLCRKIQLAEWELLFDWCYRQAVER